MTERIREKRESGEMRPLSLYLHIPFCIRKCLYCDFLSGPGTPEAQESYVRALCREIERRAADGICGDISGCAAGGSVGGDRGPDCVPGGDFGGDRGSGCVPGGDFGNVRRLDRSLGGSLGGDLRRRPVDTVFFGGGTPSLLTAGQMERIMETLRASFRIREDAEITAEANPGTVDREKLRAFRACGINRLSLGVQSLCDGELRALGRIHTAEQAREAYALARECGFSNVNVDVMAALPGQSAVSYERTLKEICGWEPEHISAYSLIVEEGTPFYTMDLALPDEDEERRMYHRTKELLALCGYTRYEISNYAKPGRECRHNVGYWTGHDYLGLGLGASSLLSHTRLRATADAGEYAAQDGYEEIHRLSLQERMEEFMFLGLRLTAGIPEAEFAERFGRRIDEIYGKQLERHAAQGLLVREDGRIRLTDRGLDVSNYVMADYLLDS
ncbi:MAG: radical SAM family heme chaperone HemW [Eubacteriales bacterium]|nr:radical SAM family heme chaperone HemW [Eubacteriales bacterium]